MNQRINDSDPIDSVIDSLSLYIHFPWCIQKCPYCDFNSQPKTSAIDENSYLQALIDDLKSNIEQFKIERPLSSIFFGGGTPSLISVNGLAWLLEGISQQITISQHAEITLEANPGTFTADTPSKWRSAGINRVSLGVQSFSDNHLRRLGRIHSSQQAKSAIEWCQNIFDRINIDLMFGLPDQTCDDISDDIATLLSFDCGHASWYQLTIEPDTLFGENPPELPGEEIIEAISTQITQSLTKASYKNYEISAWSKPGHECQHNLNYWRYGDYLGIGTGAHGKICVSGKTFRTTRPSNPERYLKTSPIAFTEINSEEVITEFLLNALRLQDGFSEKLFSERTGKPFSFIKKRVSIAIEQGLLTHSNRLIKPTNQGHRYLDTLLSILV